MKGRKTRSS